MLKRFTDFLLSFLGIVFLSPVFVVIALIIKLNDNGPVIFKQDRIGKEGKPFKLFKFRSMRILNSACRGIFEPGNNLRVTSVGRFLRRTKLDELPQLFNVIKGDMSLVGPRPEVKKWVAVYPERWANVLKVKPGMTDNSSIFFRNEETLLAESDDPEKTYKEIVLPKKLDLYEEYVINHSFFGDLKLVFKTFYYILFK